MDNNQLNNLAAEIAKVVADDATSFDLAALLRRIELLDERLGHLESAALQPNVLPFLTAVHPSHEKFTISEEWHEVESGTSEHKVCTFEPHARPCDNCSMCTARGF
jgi:hypothetical protein